jgi:site-specific recombinase XerD
MPALPAIFQEAINVRAAELREKSRAAATRRAYQSDWKHFTSWTLTCGVQSLPAAPETVETYVTALTLAQTPRGQQYAVQTIARRLAAIAHFHRQARQPDPTQDEIVKTCMSGVRRDAVGRATNAKSAIRVRHLRKGLKGQPTAAKDIRNRALLLIGFAGGFRRSELVGIDVEHLTFNDEGAVKVTLPKSKTNQEGKPESVWILPAGSLCPVKALRAWLEVSGIVAGPVFVGVDRHKNLKGRLSTDAVACVVKRLARTVGLDPKEFSAHSLRAGLVTEGFAQDVPLELIQAQTRHRTVDVLMRYRRDCDAQKRNVSDRLGL